MYLHGNFRYVGTSLNYLHEEASDCDLSGSPCWGALGRLFDLGYVFSLIRH